MYRQTPARDCLLSAHRAGAAGIAEAHKGECANIIAQFANNIASGEPPVLCGDGEQTRDFSNADAETADDWLRLFSFA